MMNVRWCVSVKKIEPKSLIFIGAAILCAVILIVIGTGTDEEKKINDMTVVEEYEKSLETKLCSMISALKGVSDVKVMVSAGSGYEKVYAVNTEENDELKKSEYYNGSDRQALLLKELVPSVNGVAVVCKGGDNILVAKKITELASGALGVSAAPCFCWWVSLPNRTQCSIWSWA